ncbi:hypothetical protein CSW64_14855 [Caulobacter mirabilis]|uniref:Uncharacterized protein n=1 Tax=Caulobacter mirabilis TaxID=69666 RepID=A0A2D2B080_9CAUL|nr:hypothetical protein CSW64_14855 [Caulobacter mirabilis]
MTRPSFTQADIKRAVQAVEAVGKSVAAVDFPPQGGFRVLLGEPEGAALAGRSGENEWDEVLRQQ